MTFALLLDEALKLPQRERETLCTRLWESLREPAGEDSPLLVEMRERLQHAEEHPGDLEDWENVKTELRAARGITW